MSPSGTENAKATLRTRLSKRLLSAEARFYLLSFRLALRIVPFRQMARLFARRAKGPELSGAERAVACQDVRQAIRRINRRRKGVYTCLHRAATAQAMLRRRGVSTTLVYGACTRPNQGLAGHAWLEDGGHGVLGHVVAGREGHHPLACFPERVPKTSGTVQN